MVFRRRWGFHFAAMRQGTILNTDEVQKKVLHDKMRDQEEAQGHLWGRLWPTLGEDIFGNPGARSGGKIVYPEVGALFGSYTTSYKASTRDPLLGTRFCTLFLSDTQSQK